MILLANIFTSLEIANGNQIQLKNLEFFKSTDCSTLLCLAIYCERLGKEWCSVIARFGSLMCHLECSEAGLGLGAMVSS